MTGPGSGRPLSRRAFAVGALGAVAAVAGCGRAAEVPAPGVSPTAGLHPPATAPVAVPRRAGVGPLFGLDVPYADQTAVDLVSAQLQRAPVLVSRFVKLDSAFTVADLSETGSGAGRVPVITLEPWSYVSTSGDVDQPAYSLRSIVEGDHDEALRRIAHVFADYGRQVLVRFAHEMNADWYPWAVTVNDNTDGLYVQAWRRVFSLVSAIAPLTEWVWAPVAAWWRDQRALHPLYPGDDHVHYVGATGYGRGASAEDTFGGWWQEVRGFTRKPALLAETGASGAGKVAWMGSFGDFLNAHDDVSGFVWFNTAPATTGATADYRLNDSPAHLAAFEHMLVAAGAVCLGVAHR